jgi:hypothetical protein
LNKDTDRNNGISSESTTRISLVLHRKIYGKPKCAVVYNYEETDSTNNKRRNDMIILSLDTGKIVIFRYNPVENLLHSILQCNTEEGALGLGSAWLHLDLPFDGAYLRQQPLGCGTIGCYLTVDNENALCCAVLFGEHLLFTILPRSSDRFDRDYHSNGKINGLKTDAASDQFTVDLRSAPLSLLGPILDVCFVSGYSHPAIAILQETGVLPIGHASHVRHTCRVTVLAVDRFMHCCTVLWQQAFLPHDSLFFVPLQANTTSSEAMLNPAFHATNTDQHTGSSSDQASKNSAITRNTFTGGVALVSLNALLIVTQEKVSGLATNGFAAVSVSKHINLTPWME